jgi:HEAT repeat protein
VSKGKLSPDTPIAEVIDELYRLRRSGDQSCLPTVRALLDHEEPMVREEALALLVIKWKREELVPSALRMLATDVDDGVRAQAAIALGTLGPAGVKLGLHAHLSAFALSHDVPERVRVACVEALSTLAGRPTIFEPEMVNDRLIGALMQTIESAQR